MKHYTKYVPPVIADNLISAGMPIDYITTYAGAFDWIITTIGLHISIYPINSEEYICLIHRSDSLCVYRDTFLAWDSAANAAIEEALRLINEKGRQ